MTTEKNRGFGQSVQLYTETFGAADAPPIIFSHGFGGSARNFRLQARVLEPDFRVTLLDLRGHARSPAPEGAEHYRMSAFLEDLDELVLAQQGPVILAGLSLGAKISLGYALANAGTGRVRALLLASYPGEADKRRAWALGFAEAIETRGLDAAGAEFVWGDRTRFDEKGAKLIRQGLMEHAPHALAHIQREVLAVAPSPRAFADELRALDVPTCVIAGSEDTESLGPCRELAQYLPNATLHEIAGAGHVVNLAKPTLFNQTMTAFLEPFRSVK